MRKTWLSIGLLALSVAASACNDNKLANQGPKIEVQPSAIAFDATLPGSTNTKVATVTNHGGSVLTVDDMQIGGADAADFQFQATGAGPFPISLGPGAWFAVQVTYAPTAAGEHSGTLTVFSNDPVRPSVDVPLTTPSMAPDIDAQPNPLAFGAVTVNQTVTNPIVISNVGAADLHVSGAVLDNGSSPALTVDASALPATITPGASVNLPVTYHPTSATAAAGSVTISSDDPDEATVTVPISGSGTTNPVPDINAVPNVVNFGDVQRQTCSTKTTQVQNVGAATLNVTGISRAIFTSAEYTWTPNTFSVAPGQAKTLSVTYCPVDTGVDLGTLNVASNDPDENPYGIGLYGNGTPPPLSQTDIALELTWDKNDTDVDTHFWRPGASYKAIPGDVWYEDLHPDWNAPGANDDPFLDYDDIDGYGPENMNYSNSATGVYTIAMFYFGDHNNGPTTATLKVYLNGTLAWQGTHLLVNHDLWNVGTVNWNHTTDSGTFSLTNTITPNTAPIMPGQPDPYPPKY